MPPRESQSTFPDQFLNLDFEASVGPLVHHHQQQQQPQPQQQQPQQQPPPPQPPQPPLDPIENNVVSDAPSAPQPGRPWNVRVRSRHVDPLSIDPTTNPPVRSVSTASHDSDSMLSLGGPLPLSPNAPASLLTSVLDNDSATDSDDDDDDDDVDIIRRLASQTSDSHAVPDLDTTHASTDDSSSDNQEVVLDSVVLNTNDNNHQTSNHVAFSPVRLFRGSSNVVTDEDASSTSSNQSLSSPIVVTEGDSLGSASSSQTPNLQWNLAFESPSDSPAGGSAASNASSNQTLSLSFGPNTSVADLKYFAERGCIVPLLNALSSPRLKTLGTRMLADYAKMPHRRVAVASNQRILEFCVETMLDTDEGPEWPAREYAVETIRSLTATEEGDSYLMNCPSLLQTLALVARGEPFLNIPRSLSEPIVKGLPPSPEGNVRRFRRSSSSPSCASPSTNNNPLSETQTGLASGKARLHACIAIMNLSCGKSNKIEIASIPKILEAMRDVMLGTHPFLPSSVSSTPTSSIADEARLKAATCIKNLSNADANDGALLSTSGLVEALGYTAFLSCSSTKGATTCTTNACLALMNLSINKANKHKVFRTRGVMDSLITVISRTSKFAQAEQHRAGKSLNCEARIKACSALSNLAIGYDNKIPMFQYPGFVAAILNVINTDNGEARTKACSILWSFAAEMKNQVPVVQRGDILPTLVRVAEEDHSTEARFKCVAALTLLAESLENAVPLLESGALHPLMDILHEAGPDPTQWKGQTASWCVGFLMNMAQSDEAVPSLRESGVVELLAPLLTLDHYQSLKAAMAVTFVCRYDKDDETYDLLRKTENVIPKITSLLHNTLSGRGGHGYKYGVFTLRSSVGCISSLASGPDFMKERIATSPVFGSLLRVISDFCVDGGTPGAIVGGGKDDPLSATLAIRALQSLTAHLIPIPGSSALPFNPSIDQSLITALESFEQSKHPEIKDETIRLAHDARVRIQGSQELVASGKPLQDGILHGSAPCTPTQAAGAFNLSYSPEDAIGNNIVKTLAQSCCGLPTFGDMDEDTGGWLPSYSLLSGNFVANSPNTSTTDVIAESEKSSPSSTLDTYQHIKPMEYVVDCDDSTASSVRSLDQNEEVVRTFLLTDTKTGRRFAVPIEPSGGRSFTDNRVWCFRRGRFCRPGESPDPNFRWTEDLQDAYTAALALQRSSNSVSSNGSDRGGSGAISPTNSSLFGQQ